MSDLYTEIFKKLALVRKSSEGINKAVASSNVRLCTKYLTELQKTFDAALPVIHEFIAETNPDPKSQEFQNCDSLQQIGTSAILEAEEFLANIEEKRSKDAEIRVTKARVDDLEKSIKTLGLLLETSPEDLIVGVEDVSAVVQHALDERQSRFSKTEEAKQDLYALCIDDENLFELFTASVVKWDDLDIKFATWSCQAKAILTKGRNKPASPSSPKLGLKIDRVALPTFDGTVRAYARFKREFDATVGVVYQDPSIKLLYLQNQCLLGAAKELVRNLTTYDSVVERLDEHYGVSAVVVNEIVKEIEQLKLGNDPERNTIKVHDVLQSCWDDANAVGALNEFCNVVTLRALESKLPDRVQIKWLERKVQLNSTSIRNQLDTLRTLLETERKISESVSSLRGKGNSQGKFEPPKGKKFSGHVSKEQNPEASPNTCFRCGIPGHVKMNCKVPRTIRCRGCNKIGHMERACRDVDKSRDSDSKTANAKGSQTEEIRKQVKFSESNPVHTKSCVVNECVRLPVEEVSSSVGQCNILYDTGSMINIVKEAWAVKKGLKGRSYELEYKVVDGETKRLKTKLYSFRIKVSGSRVVTVRAYGMTSIMKDLRKPDIERLKAEFTEEVCGVSMDRISFPLGEVHVLLGTEFLSHFPELVWSHGDACIMKSRLCLGSYVLAGSHPLFAGTCSSDGVYHASLVEATPIDGLCETYVHQIQDKRRKELGADFFSLEALGTTAPKLCKACKTCSECSVESQMLNYKEASELQVIKANLAYNENQGFWTTKYPFMQDPCTLNDNYSVALEALQRRETRLLKDSKLSDQYEEQVKDFVSRGVLRKLTEEEIKEWTGPVRYVDHHEVFKEGSTTPVRVVVNSSFKRGDEKSLNDILLKGPSLLKDIFEVLVRWRTYPVAFIGDIKKMYHTVRTYPLEGHVRRFLWRGFDQSRDPDIYVFDRVTFGDRPAGCIVVTALHETAKMFESYNHEAALVILQDSYVDDIVSGAQSLEEAKALVKDIELISGYGDFSFKKFLFSGQPDNGKDILGSTSLNGVLGINWDSEADRIVFLLDLSTGKRVKGKRLGSEDLSTVGLTKRICLRLVNSIFDPLGILSPVTITLKLLMKETFVVSSGKLGWDQVLPEPDLTRWRELLLSLGCLNRFSIPRCVFVDLPAIDLDQVKPILIIFVDASLKGMCAAAYVRFISFDGSSRTTTQLFASKTRVSPVDRVTIPRLELSAALIGARLGAKIKKAVKFAFERVIYLSDSKVVLGMLKNSKSLLKEYVGVRVHEIRSLSDVDDWAWVPSAENVADIGTKGVDPAKFVQLKTWLTGPNWLRLSLSEWPVSFDTDQKLYDEDVKLGHVLATTTVSKCRLDAANFSTLQRLLKVTAYILKFIASLKSPKPQQIDCDWTKIVLTAEDFSAAENYWLRQVSRSVMDMYEAGKLSSLRPCLVWDDKGKFQMVVTSGRVGKLTKIGYDRDQLVILDPSHPYTRLVLKDIHCADHSGDSRVVWKSRCKFWIPSARKVVRSIRRSCYVCRILSKRFSKQVMAPLPDERMLPAPAWSNVSLDLFGPIEHVDMVKKRTSSKAWGLIVTCLVTRAVHLDLTQTYETDSLLQALHRFVCLRGTPLSILSDQGSQLKAASMEVVNMFELLDWNIVKGWCAKRGMKWRFTPVQGQHVNGCSEALIKSTKRILLEKIWGKRLNYVDLQTVLYDVAQILNSRPLGIYTQPGDDPLDGGPITPNHLLLGRASSTIPDIPYDYKASLTKRMRFIKSIIEDFWEKWRIVAFDSLVPQYKWHRKFRASQVGDVVLIQDDNSKLREFKLGIVIGTKVGLDGLPRSLTIRYVSGNDRTKAVTSRPVQKVVTLVPIEEQ